MYLKSKANYRKFLAALSMVVGATWAGNSFAHHSFAAEFDAEKPVTLKGSLTKIEWTNPHGWLYIDVKNDQGEVVNWAIETGSPNALLRRGLRKNMLEIGSELVIKGYLSKKKEATANAGSVTLPDGTPFLVGSSGRGAPKK